MRASLDTVRDWVSTSRRIVVLSGAGISTESGIPDFRGPNGLWTRDPDAEKLSDIRYYLADSEVRRKAWLKRLSNPGWTAQPNAGHKAIVELERRGQLHALITQNIDGLHQKAGTSPERVIEVHGTMHSVLCWDCGATGPMLPVLERVRSGEDDPRCADCGGILKSATILFGEGLKPGVMERAVQAAVEADLLIAVGSTLQVYPVAGVVPAAKEAGAR
ncbi:MAG: Sir2 family NAD-dependent protein deacetylase, partial [Proteobacteria bacterium]|nr:Sir2 family NAD-dependent protein deacetylase [Pseudomonadota bacterium]